jgi:hypothetical protein
MSDQAAIIPQTPEDENHANLSLSESDFRRFLIAKSSNSRCSFCDHEHFGIVTEDGSTATQIHMVVGDSRRQFGFYPLAGVVCNNCGHLHTFFWKTIQEWLIQEVKVGNEL